MKRIIFLVCLSCFILSGCKESNKKHVQAETTEKRLFSIPEIPKQLTKPKERAVYLAEHYWDYSDFSDTSLTKTPGIIEPAFADFIGVLPHATYPAACNGIKKLLLKVGKNQTLFLSIIGLADKYLYDIDSPMRNEEFYIPFMKSAIDSKLIDEPHKIRFRDHLTMALKNRPDSIATDFAYTLSNGKESLLSKDESEFVLLFFNNPECEVCEEVREKIVSSPILTTLQQSTGNGMKKLTVLSVYTEDNLAFWKKQLWKNPSIWICGYDRKRKIRNNRLYDLKKIPSLYLLDKEKRVLLKDVSPEVVEEYFSER